MVEEFDPTTWTPEWCLTRAANCLQAGDPRSASYWRGYSAALENGAAAHAALRKQCAELQDQITELSTIIRREREAGFRAGVEAAVAELKKWEDALRDWRGFAAVIEDICALAPAGPEAPELAGLRYVRKNMPLFGHDDAQHARTDGWLDAEIARLTAPRQGETA